MQTQIFAGTKQILTVLMLALLLVGGFSVFNNGALVSAAPTVSSCKHFEGNYFMNKAGDKAAFKKYQNDPCSNKICVATPHAETDDSGNKFTVEVVACSNPNQPTPTTASCKDGTQDEALCAPKCQQSSDCNLTTTYINPFINKFLAPFAILAVIIGIIWGGIEFSTAGGDAQKVASAKGKIQKALIALVAFMFLWAFLEWLIPGGLI